uniref:Uncharacterized protein n=1 Tax=Cacopsylla melanoneura TaxID=428564 RepID=A0A8D8TWC3_9HEMI
MPTSLYCILYYSGIHFYFLLYYYTSPRILLLLLFLGWLPYNLKRYTDPLGGLILYCLWSTALLGIIRLRAPSHGLAIMVISALQCASTRIETNSVQLARSMLSVYLDHTCAMLYLTRSLQRSELN